MCAVSSNPESASSFRLWLCWLRSSTPVTYWCMLPGILPLPPCHRADDSADFANRDVSAAFRFAGYPAARV
ncbi:hypothetical protein CYG68_09100 [Morganella morganii]|uniref:Uncharacterized protein n=1 Tax=Morganella morganii TaxID=582 RepID=A0A8I0Q251_MORMO|nr:hypothetical protein [Morganella morganii]